MEQDKLKAETFEHALNIAVKNGDDAGLMEACKEFEAYFLNVMFKEMRKTISSEKKSSSEQTFMEMLDDEYAKKAANTGGIGLASFMYRQMKRENSATTQD